MWTENFQMYKLDLAPEIKLSISTGSQKNQEKSRKSSISALLTMLQPFTMCITTNWAKFKRWEYQNTLLASWENWMQIKKQQLEQDMKQWTGSKLGKEYMKVVYCQPAYLTCMQSTSCKMPGWIKHKLESRLPREISITSDMQMTLMAENKEELKSLLIKWKRRVKKLAKNSALRKQRPWHLVPSLLDK